MYKLCILYDLKLGTKSIELQTEKNFTHPNSYYFYPYTCLLDVVNDVINVLTT